MKTYKTKLSIEITASITFVSFNVVRQKVCATLSYKLD